MSRWPSRLSEITGLPIRPTPGDYNYLLAWEGGDAPSGECFIPFDSILLASDKRTLAEVFAAQRVATPETHLLGTPEAVWGWVREHGDRPWVLKWPTGCGASGHRLIVAGMTLPEDWPRPFVVQEFIHLAVPEVYRLYAVAGETFGWNVRRFPPGVAASPFVAHARGARYEAAGHAPPEAEAQSRRALAATGLLDSFGCVDLMRDDSGRWLVLEVNTDGVFSHIDREIGVGNIAQEIETRLAQAILERQGSQDGANFQKILSGR